MLELLSNNRKWHSFLKTSGSVSIILETFKTTLPSFFLKKDFFSHLRPVFLLKTPGSGFKHLRTELYWELIYWWYLTGKATTHKQDPKRGFQNFKVITHVYPGQYASGAILHKLFFIKIMFMCVCVIPKISVRGKISWHKWFNLLKYSKVYTFPPYHCYFSVSFCWQRDPNAPL